MDMRVFPWEPLTLPGGIVPAEALSKYLESFRDIRVQPLHKDPGVMKRTATERSLPGTRGGRGPMSQHNRFRTMLLVSAAGLLALAGSTKAAPSTYVELVADCNQEGDDCGPDELCVELTEFAGPSDGGGPMVSYTCHDIPGACGDTITCECAGFLCPGDGGGARGMCDTDGEVLFCSVAYP